MTRALDRVQVYRKRLQSFLWRHVVWSVLIFLCSTWATSSYWVYLYEHKAQGANITTLNDSIWWGIVTMLTVGYGDKFPITPEARFVAGILMVSGVGCVGIITAKISSIFLEQALRDGRGILDTDQIRNHFIICGWNENMHDLVTHILDFNVRMTSKDIIILANVSQPQVDALCSDPRLADLHVVIGDHFSEMNLRRTAPDKAKKVLILADRNPGANGQLPTPTEIDARTIMTAMTLSNLARGTVVTAEILDPKMDHYLKLANVTEIIYSSEYSRLLLGNASTGTGIANIVFDLLDRTASAHITSRELPEHLIGKFFRDVKGELERSYPDLLVIGLLENSGNSHGIKEMALRRAQQTPDMAQLLENLQSIKELRCNNPVFHPAPDYPVQEGSMAIVIAKRRRRSHNGFGEKTLRIA